MCWRYWLIWLLWPACLQAQVTIGERAGDASAPLQRTSVKALSLAVGEFEIIEPAPSVTGPLLWLTSQTSCVQTLHVAPQQTLAIWMKRRGEATARLHHFPARTVSWIIVIGVQPGQSSVMVIRNGAKADQPPELVDQVEVSVGGPAPMPPTPPVDDALVKALRTAFQRDQQAGLASKPWLLALAEVYQTASRDSLTSVQTVGELDTHLNNARLKAGIPEADKTLPALRECIRQEWLAYLMITDADHAVVLTPETRRAAQQFLARLARALEVIAP
ncbi:MAG: hypothetical protein JNJ77_06235 [Planctomycetia bacterium]|nr:hypothetical protein [Planctomycetia bacterium]